MEPLDWMEQPVLQVSRVKLEQLVHQVYKVMLERLVRVA
jgi:hypothetical protein